MKKGWRIIIVIVLVAILLGAVGVGVGLMTGADLERIWTTLDERYHVLMYWDYCVEVFHTVQEALLTPAA